MADTRGQVSDSIYSDTALVASWSLVSQDIITNSSVISVSSYVSYTPIVGERYINSVGSTVYINNSYMSELSGSAVHVYVGWGGGLQPNYYLFTNKLVTIKHNLDGSKSFDMRVNNGTTKTFILPELPQASKIMSFPNFTIDSSFAVSISRASESYTHDLILKIGNNIVKTVTGVGTSTTISLSNTEQNIIYQAIPNATSGVVTLTCQTKNGTTNIGGTISATATATVPSNIVPSFTSLSHSELNSNVSSIVGAYTKGLSNIRFTINGATGVKYSTVKSYQIVYRGATYNTSTLETGIINWSGDQTITATITDSRGRTASKSITVNALDYVSPTVTNFNVIRCNSDGSANLLGTFAKVIRVGNVSSLNSKNNYIFAIYSRSKGVTSWGSSRASGSSNVGEINMNFNNVLNGYDVTSSYEFRLDFSDKFNTTTVYFTLSTGEVVMSLGKTGIGVGKIYEQGALDVHGDMYIDGKINGLNLGDLQFLQSARDFTDGTLIETDIKYAVSNGEPFLLEIEGNSYGAITPFLIKLQGCIYNGTIINNGGLSVGAKINGIVAFNYNSRLCFWFPRQSYWQGFNVFINSSYSGIKKNRVLSIKNSAKPSGVTKEVAFNIKYVSYEGHTHTGSDISGALPTNVVATNGTDYTTSRLRNIRFGTTVPTSLANGEIYILYE